MVSKRKHAEMNEIIGEAKKKRIIKFKEAMILNNFDYVRRQIIDSVITKKEIDESAIIQKVVTKGPEHLKIVKYLVKQGANINLPNPRDKNLTPINNVALFMRLHKNHKDTLEKVIKMGADIHIPDSELRTPLMNCIIHTRFEDSIELLIEKGSNLSATDREGCTPLHFASMYNLPKIVTKMLQFGLDNSNVKDIDGMTPILYAIVEGNEKVVIQILKFSEPKIDLKVTNKDGFNAMELAFAENNQRMMKLILYNNLHHDLP